MGGADEGVVCVCVCSVCMCVCVCVCVCECVSECVFLCVFMYVWVRWSLRGVFGAQRANTGEPSKSLSWAVLRIYPHSILRPKEPPLGVERLQDRILLVCETAS